MKNNRINISIFALLFLFLSSCYEDKGNYDYTEINRVSITGLESQYQRYTNIDNLSISIELEDTSDGTIEYDYVWTISNSRDDNRKDTISTDKTIDYFINVPPGTYNILLTATEKTTSIPHFFTSKLIVETRFTRGWYLLKEIDGDSELDLHNETISLSNLLTDYSDIGKMKGKPVSLGYFNGRIILQTENALNMIDKESMTLISDYNELFLDAPTVVPRQIGFATSLMSTNIIDESGIYYYSTYQAIGFPLKTSDEKPYRLTGYTAKDRSNLIHYDQLNCRFLTHASSATVLMPFKDEGKDGAIQQWVPNNLDADLLYMDTQSRIYNSEKEAYAILKKRSGAKDILVFSLDFSAIASKSNPIKKGFAVPPNSGIYNATVFGNNMNYAALYYNNGNKLGMYDLLTNTQKDVYTFDSNEEITFITNFVYSGTQIAPINKIVVTTYFNGNYKLYLFDILEGMPTGTPLIYEGKGRVKEVLHTNVGSSNQNSSYR